MGRMKEEFMRLSEDPRNARRARGLGRWNVCAIAVSGLLRSGAKTPMCVMSACDGSV